MTIDYNSPNVKYTETSVGLTLTGDSSTIGAYAGFFRWGPVQEITTLVSGKDLENKFYTPDDECYEHWYSANDFLAYTTALKAIRVIKESSAMNGGIKFKDSAAASPTPSAFSVLRNNLLEDVTGVSYVNNEKCAFFAKYPGDIGNSIQIAVCGYDDWDTGLVDTGVLIKNQFEYAPADSSQFGIYVVGFDGEIETHIVSETPGAVDEFGNDIFVDTYLDINSDYIGSVIDTSNANQFYNTQLTSLASGVDEAPSEGEINTKGYSLFIDSDSVEINTIFDGANTSSTNQEYIIDNVLEVRKDCFGFLGVPKSIVVNQDLDTAITAIVAHKTKSTSYAAMYANYKYRYDSYNNKYRWIPIGPDAAGRWAYNAVNIDYWYGPFGPDGALKNCRRLAISPLKTHRDTLYKAGINPVIYDKDYGTFTFLGQKTMLNSPTDFNRIDVRMLFLYIEKAITKIVKFYFNRKNNAVLRREHINTVTPFFDDIVGRQGIKAPGTNGPGYYVQCDEDNNPSSVVDAGGFAVKYLIKPEHAVEFIGLTFTSVKGDVNFEELTGTA